MKQIILINALAFILSSSLYAKGNFQDIEPIIDIPVVDLQEKRDYNMAVKFGTLGIGFDVSTTILENLAVRFNVNGLQYNHTEEIDDISYAGTLNLLTAGALVDYFPLGSAFRVTGGAYYNGNKFTGIAVPTATIPLEINGITYGMNDIGQLDTEITFTNIAPYVGLGWGNDVRTEGWGFSLDVGAMYHDSAQVDLDVTVNNAILESQIRNDVAHEKQKLLNEIEKYKIYPVIMMGVNYTF
ncbi:MAG: hypothetical protein L3J43_09970 [Sulfurovum sp.]|nr:hypothetical protein [Sulfurovum sp.]